MILRLSTNTKCCAVSLVGGGVAGSGDNALGTRLLRSELFLHRLVLFLRDILKCVCFCLTL